MREHKNRKKPNNLKVGAGRIFNVKGEKGGITVFVLTAMLFMLIALVLTYMGVTNKNQAQAKDVVRIKKEYEVSEEQIHKIYEEVRDNTMVGVTFNKNGGMYYIAKDGRITIKSVITIRDSDEVKVVKAQYGYSNSETMPPREWNGINKNEKEIEVQVPECSEGKYYIWVNYEDSKGVKKTVKSNAFEVKESEITFSKNPEGYTRESVEVTVLFQQGLTKNRKVGIGATRELAKANAVAVENSNIGEGTSGIDSDKITGVGSVTVEEISYVYAEAEDKYGNKTEGSIYVDNIDKDAPIIKIIPNGGKYYLRGKETQTIEVEVKVVLR